MLQGGGQPAWQDVGKQLDEGSGLGSGGSSSISDKFRSDKQPEKLDFGIAGYW